MRFAKRQVGSILRFLPVYYLLSCDAVYGGLWPASRLPATDALRATGSPCPAGCGVPRAAPNAWMERGPRAFFGGRGERDQRFARSRDEIFRRERRQF